MADRPKGPFGPSETDLRPVRALERFLARLVKNPQDAEDLAQEARLRALSSGPAQRARQPTAYLRRIARNLAFQFLKSRGRDRVTYDTEKADDRAEELSENEKDLIEQLTTAEHLEGVLAEIPETYRRVLLMSLCDGLTPQQIADRLGLSLTTVNKYLVRARAYARQYQWE